MRRVKSRILAFLLFAAPVAAFVLVLNWNVGLVPLTGMDTLCSQCDRKATRTLASAATALQSRGIYVYDRSKYPKGPPVWCDSHGPDPESENAGTALASALGVFALSVVAYRGLTPGS